MNSTGDNDSRAAACAPALLLTASADESSSFRPCERSLVLARARSRQTMPSPRMRDSSIIHLARGQLFERAEHWPCSQLAPAVDVGATFLFRSSPATVDRGENDGRQTDG